MQGQEVALPPPPAAFQAAGRNVSQLWGVWRAVAQRSMRWPRGSGGVLTCMHGLAPGCAGAPPGSRQTSFCNVVYAVSGTPPATDWRVCLALWGGLWGASGGGVRPVVCVVWRVQVTVSMVLDTLCKP